MYPGLVTRTAAYAARRTPAPTGWVTNTAPTTRAAMELSLRSGKYTPDQIWGSLPVEEVEGHSPDPAYDVRPIEGLGRAPLRSERLGLGLMRDLDRMQEAQVQDRSLARPTALVDTAKSTEPSSSTQGGSSSSTLPMSSMSALVPLAIVGALLFLVKR